MVHKPSKLAAARQTGRVTRGYLRDVITRRRVSELADVPPSPKAVTPEWLTLALCEGKDARVTCFRHEVISAGTSYRSRLHLDYDGTQEAVEKLPPTVFVKSTDSLLTRLQVGALGGFSGEIRFYRLLQPTTPIPAPHGYFGKSDRRSGRAILMIEDLSRTRDVVFGDARRPLTREHAERVVDALATVHGCLLDSPRFNGDLKWMLTSLQIQKVQNAYVNFDGRTVVGFDRAGDLIPPSLRRHRTRVLPGLMHALGLDEGQPLGLIHSDVHAGNWFAEKSGDVGLFDWSAIARGQGTRDLIYALMSALTIEDRRAWERDLVARYADRRSEISGTPHDLDQVWTSYRQQALHGFVFWLYTLGSGTFQPSMQDDDVSRANIERMAQAIEDLETFRSLGL